jgi:hypothetical protein
MAQQIQERINVRMKGLDDVFHRMIIALERLETFLELERSEANASALIKTAVQTPRDLHDDKQNPPNRESVLGEVQLQCSALFFQTKFDDDDLFERTMKYFMTDLLEWYGGRDKNIPFNEVEMYVLPIIRSLSRDVKSVVEIMETTDQYVTKLRRIEDFSDEEKERAVEEGFTAFIRAQHHTGEQMQEFVESGAEVELTSHKRGTATEGYVRLMRAMVTLYSETTPAKTIRKIFNAYVEGLPEFTDQQIKSAVDKYSSKQELSKDDRVIEDANGDKGDNTTETATDEPADSQGTRQERRGFLKRWFMD